MQNIQLEDEILQKTIPQKQMFFSFLVNSEISLQQIEENQKFVEEIEMQTDLF